MAGGSIKGITIAINGDVTPLNKSLQSVDNSTKKVQNELKQVERLLKFDPGNVDLLAQKQQLLTNAIDNTSQRLQTLKNSQAEVQAQFERGEIGADQFRAFQREIIATEGQLDAFRNQLNRLNTDVDIDVDSSDLEQAEGALKRFGDRVSETADKAKEIGKNLSSTVTPAVAGFGTAAIVSAAQFDNANAQIQAALGATAEEAERLGDISESVWKKGFGEDLNEVTNALVRVKQNMQGISDVELETVTTNALALAKTFDSDVNEVTRAANNLMINFGVESEKAFDILATGAQSGLNFSNELFDNVAEYAPLWADMGYSIEEMFGILSEGAKQGVYNLDYVNDVMKEFQIRATDGSKSTGEAVAALGNDTKLMWEAFSNGSATVSDMAAAAVTELSKIDDKVKQNELGVALFGTKWEDLGGDVVLAMLEGGVAMDDFNGKMQKIRETQEGTFGAQWQSFTREAAQSLEPLGLILLEIAEELLPTIIEKVEDLAKKFSELSKPVQLLIVGFGAFVAIMLPLIAIITPIISAIIKIGSVIGTLIGWVIKVVRILATFRYAIIAIGGPIAIAIGIITGLIAIGISLYKNWDEVSAFVKKAFNSMKEGIKSSAEKIKSTVSDLTKKVVKFFKDNLNKKTLINVAKDLVLGLANGIKNSVKYVKDAAKDLGDAAAKAVKSALKIKSPSRVMMELGMWAGVGLANGIEGTKKDVEKASENVSKVIVNATKKNTASIVALEKEANKEKKKIQDKYAADFAKLKAKDNKKRIELEKKMNAELKKVSDKLAKDTKDTQKKLQQEQMDAVVSYIEKKKKANELSLVQESAYWRKAYSQFKTGSSQRIALEEKYAESVKAINEGVTKLNQDYVDKAKKIDDDLISNIESANKDYQSAYDSRYNTVKGYYGLLAEVQDDEEASAEQMFKNLRDQGYALKEWQNLLQDLANRGIGDALYSELEDLGPSALSNLRALTNLTDDELNHYVALFEDKMATIKQITDKDLAPLKETTKQNIIAMEGAATVELANLNQEWQKSIVNLVGATEKQLTTLKQVGKNAAQSLLDGLTSMQSSLVTQAKAMAEAISKTINQSLNLGDFSSIPAASLSLNNSAMSAGSLLNGSTSASQKQQSSNQITIQQQQQDNTALVNAVLQLANNQPDVKLVVDGRELASIVSRNQYNTASLDGLVKGMTI